MRIALEETVPPPKPIFTPDNFEEEFMQWIREKNQKEYEAFCRSVDWDSIKVTKCNEYWVRFKLWVLDKYYILTVFAVKWNCSKGAPKSERAIGQ